MKKFLFLLAVLLVLTGCSHKPNKDNMPNSRDLLYTLERLEMPPEDVELWRQYLVGVDSAGSHFGGGDTLSVGSIETGQVQSFGTAPLESFRLTRDNNQTISDSTYTPIEWERVVLNTGLLEWDSSDPTKVFIKSGSSRKAMLVTVLIRWDSNSSGLRSISLQGFDSSDSQTFVRDIDRSPATSFYAGSASYLLVYDPEDTYIKILAYQTSGGNADVIGAQLAIIWIH